MDAIVIICVGIFVLWAYVAWDCIYKPFEDEEWRIDRSSFDDIGLGVYRRRE